MEEDLRATVRDLRRRLAEAERTGAEKTRFIRHVSHEFRTPLSSILGYAALLAEGGERLPPDARAEYLGVLHRNARHLLHVANDLLNISKVEAGTLEVTLAPVRVADLASAVVVALEPQAQGRGVRVALEEAGAPTARADSGRLRQVLFNLLENAVKYSPPGGAIVVRARAAGERVRLEVEDRGPGIAPDDRGRLFREFSRLNPPGTRVAGAGLGLALSRMLVEAMGGEIGVQSAPGRGSTFWVELPGAAAPPCAPAAAPPLRPRTRVETVAVVEDDADLRGYAAAVLERAGYRVAADDGSPGAGARLAAAVPALALLDLHLGARSGVEVLAELRHAGAGCPVLAFSAGAAGEAEEAGFAGRVEKPVEPAALVAAVDAALEAERAVPDDDFLAPLRARFRAGLVGRGDAIAAARAAGDGAALGRELHKLRGAAAGYGFDALSDAAADAEAAPEEEREAALETLLALLDRAEGP